MLTPVCSPLQYVKTHVLGMASGRQGPRNVSVCNMFWVENPFKSRHRDTYMCVYMCVCCVCVCVHVCVYMCVYMYVHPELCECGSMVCQICHFACPCMVYVHILNGDA